VVVGPGIAGIDGGRIGGGFGKVGGLGGDGGR
jgi:hypothetical protein